MKNILRRGLSLILCMMICGSMFGIPVSATRDADVTTDDENIEIIDNPIDTSKPETPAKEIVELPADDASVKAMPQLDSDDNDGDDKTLNDRADEKNTLANDDDDKPADNGKSDGADDDQNQTPDDEEKEDNHSSNKEVNLINITVPMEKPELSELEFPAEGAENELERLLELNCFAIITKSRKIKDFVIFLRLITNRSINTLIRL